MNTVYVKPVLLGHHDCKHTTSTHGDSTVSPTSSASSEDAFPFLGGSHCMLKGFFLPSMFLHVKQCQLEYT